MNFAGGFQEKEQGKKKKSFYQFEQVFQECISAIKRLAKLAIQYTYGDGLILAVATLCFYLEETKWFIYLVQQVHW